MDGLDMISDAFCWWLLYGHSVSGVSIGHRPTPVKVLNMSKLPTVVYRSSHSVRTPWCFHFVWFDRFLSLFPPAVCPGPGAPLSVRYSSVTRHLHCVTFRSNCLPDVAGVIYYFSAVVCYWFSARCDTAFIIAIGWGFKDIREPKLNISLWMVVG